jgi:tRNA (adenine22-N1)-methyltransferase
MRRRLQAILSLIPRDQPLVDVGSDHGYVPLALAKAGFDHPLYATELSVASVAMLKHALVETTIHVYQANGLMDLPSEVKTMVCTGMGGHLIVEILSAHPEQSGQLKTLVLGPQRDPDIVRKWLVTHGWCIEKEDFVYEGNQGYPLLVAIRGKQSLSDIEAWYGPKLIQAPNLDFLLFLSIEARQLQRTLQHQEDKDKRLRLEWIQQYVKNHNLD